MKNPLKYAKTNASAFKISFAKRMRILSAWQYGIIAFLAVTPLSAVLGCVFAICAFAIPFMASVGNVLGVGAGGTEPTPEEKALAAIETKMAQGFVKKSDYEKMDLELKELQKSNPLLTAEVTRLATELKAMKEAGSQETKGISIEKQIENYLTENKDLIKEIKSGKKVDLPQLELKENSPMTPANTYNSSAYLPFPTLLAGINDIVRIAPTFWDYLKKGRANSAALVWVNKTTPLGAAGFIGPGVAKPGISIEITTETSTAKKIAAKIKVAIETLEDVAQMKTILFDELAYQLKYELNSKLMTGTASSTVPAGIQTVSDSYSLTTVKTTNPNNYDAIKACVAQLRSQNFVGQITAFMNPIDYANMQMTKAQSQGQLFIPMETGANIVEDNNVAVGYLQVAILDLFKVDIYKDYTITQGWENEDFTKNLVTFIGEMRLHQYFSDNNAGAFIYDSFDNIKTAIDEGNGA